LINLKLSERNSKFSPTENVNGSLSFNELSGLVSRNGSNILKPLKDLSLRRDVLEDWHQTPVKNESINDNLLSSILQLSNEGKFAEVEQIYSVRSHLSPNNTMIGKMTV
jgi:hypothetical protein